MELWHIQFQSGTLIRELWDHTWAWSQTHREKYSLSGLLEWKKYDGSGLNSGSQLEKNKNNNNWEKKTHTHFNR